MRVVVTFHGRNYFQILSTFVLDSETQPVLYYEALNHFAACNPIMERWYDNEENRYASF